MPKKVLFTLSIVIGFFVVLELTARLGSLFYKNAAATDERRWKFSMGSLIADDTLNHKWIPGIKTMVGNELTFVSNKQGWVEDYDVDMNKPPDTFRVFYVGDSNVQGRVPYEKNMVELVEKGLNEALDESETHFEVINTGVSSYSIALYYLLIKNDILPYSPDLVVINVDMTDVPNDQTYLQRAIRDGKGNLLAVPPFGVVGNERVMTPFGSIRRSWHERLDNLLRRYFVSYEMLANVLSSDQNTIFDEQKIQSVTRKNWTWIANSKQIDLSANWLSSEWNEAIETHVNESMNLLGKIFMLLRTNNVKVALTGVPHYPQYTGNWSSRPHEELAKAASTRDVPYLNSFEQIKRHLEPKQELRDLYWNDDPTHFNAAGNRVWARTQLDFLLANRSKLLTPTPPDERIRFKIKRPEL